MPDNHNKRIKYVNRKELKVVSPVHICADSKARGCDQLYFLGHDLENIKTAQFNKTVEYFNNSGEPLTITNRDGYNVTIQPTSNYGKKTLLIKTHYTISASSSEHLDEINFRDTKQSIAISDAIGTSRLTNGRKTVSTAAVIDISQISSTNFNSYFKEFDIVVSIGNGKGNYHPYSLGGNDTIAEEYVREVETGGVTISIVDSTNSVGNYYFNSSNTIVLIKPTANAELSDGVYIRSYNAAIDGTGTSESLVRHVDLDKIDTELDSILFKSYDSAKSYGNSQHIQEMERLALKNETLLLEKELKEKSHIEEAAKSQAKMAEYEEKIRVLKAKKKSDEEAAVRESIMAEAKDLREQQEYIRKNEYEERSYARKDSSETIKAVAAVSGAVVGLFALYKAFS